jgi:hypothetical protein
MWRGGGKGASESESERKEGKGGQKEGKVTGADEEAGYSSEQPPARWRWESE